MFRKLSILVAVCCISIAFRCYEPANQEMQIREDLDNREQLLMEVLLQSLKYNHYSPEDINDSFSKKVFDLYLKRLDNSKRFFLKTILITENRAVATTIQRTIFIESPYDNIARKSLEMI